MIRRYDNSVWDGVGKRYGAEVQARVGYIRGFLHQTRVEACARQRQEVDN